MKLLSLRNTRKCDKTKENRGKTSNEIAVDWHLVRSFYMHFLKKIRYLIGVFELPHRASVPPSNHNHD
jgi:hypothetical protein